MLSVAGCGGGVEPPPKTVKVHGTVTYKNSPVTKGKVTLQSTATKSGGEISRPAVGTIGPDGTFTLSTFTAGDGALPGEYRVTVESFDQELTMEEAYEGKTQTSLIPEKYSNIKTTELKATIPDQNEPYQLQLELKD